MKPGSPLKTLSEKSVDVAALFAGLSHPVRLQILCCLMDAAQRRDSRGECSVSELTEFCGISQPEVSQFLSRMKRDGLLTSRREGKRVWYSIADPALSELLQTVRALYCS